MAEEAPPTDPPAAQTPRREPRITRRHLLALAAATGAAASLGAGARVWSWWQQDAADDYLCLSPAEVDLVDALAEAMFPPGGEPSIGGGDVQAARYLDAVLDRLVDPMGDLLRMLLHALDDWARLTRGSAFAALPLPERSEALAAWTRSDSHLVRGGITGLLIFIASAFTTHPDVKQAYGFVFPCGYAR